MSKPLTFTELFPGPETPTCRRYGSAIATFVHEQADNLLDLEDRKKWREELLTVMNDTSMNATTRQWIWIRSAKSFERHMDYNMMKVSVANFKCQHGRMPTFEDIVGEDGGEYDDRSNFETVVENYEEPIWPKEFDNKDSVKKTAMEAFMTYMCGVYECARADHVASRSGAYAP